MFIELVELDLRIMNLIKEISDGEKKKILIAGDLKQIDQEVAAQEQSAKDALLSIVQLDNELKVLALEQRNTERKLISASSQKELDSLLHEQKVLVGRREELDTKAGDLLELAEKTQQDLHTLRAAKPEKIGYLQKELSEIDERLMRIAAVRPAYEQQREELIAHIPAQLVEKYTEMKTHVTNPVVPLVKESCSGCFHELSKPELVKVSHGELVTCKGCYRMIYATIVEQTESHNEQ